MTAPISYQLAFGTYDDALRMVGMTGYAALPSDPLALSVAAMFGAPVAVGDQADVQSKRLARLGRNPNWYTSLGGEGCDDVPAW